MQRTKSYHPSLALDLSTAARVMGRPLKKWLTRKEMSFSEFMILVALGVQNGMSLVEISRLYRRSHTQLSGALKALKRKRFVRGVVSRSDERINHLFLTRTGAGVWREAQKVRQEIYKRLGLTPEEIETLRRLTEKIIKSDGRL